ncbi:MAG: tRNA(Ile2) 2-agmatinylcytidine synthetase TiaS [Methanosaeta sp. PtaU1.Bin060]|nr:MAG: tRNA(Ile2) 2-agmatinylcytidine synthetase TiaS [Methanosaeta sp. PtaU1.Bin060]
MFIGIDDTDSEKGLCTTYLAAVLMERLRSLGEVKGFPKLIRLNPCARFKTRGNAAISFELESDRPEDVKEEAIQAVLELSDFSGVNTNPGLVVAERVTPRMEAFYRRALTEILEIQEARDLLDEEGIWHRGFKKGRGLIGALAAIGATLPDFTYELIVYRERQRWSTPRVIDSESVWEADERTYPDTWDTVDRQSGRVVFAPHSGDPVLFGIRGRDPDVLETAFRTIRSEPSERRVLYITNQGTDSHILDGEIALVREDQSYRLRGSVAGEPRAIAGGHLFFTLQDGGSALNCAAFEPTKGFRSIVKLLRPGDEVEVYGAVRDETLNLEKINILRLAEQHIHIVPACPICGRRMESAGRGQGYRCRRCKTHAEGRKREVADRELETGFYEVPPSARRHLAKPLVRMMGVRTHPSR